MSAGQMLAHGGVITVVVAPAVLLAGAGSVIELVTVAVLVMIVLSGVPGSTLTMSVKVAVERTGSRFVVQVIAPVPPTAGVEQLHPGGAVIV
jgi:hypothetical protein